jgi:diadenosine tetraphosphatase ApaH/serine/threonine PP2A family protein phosphatase
VIETLLSIDLPIQFIRATATARRGTRRAPEPSRPISGAGGGAVAIMTRHRRRCGAACASSLPVVGDVLCFVDARSAEILRGVRGAPVFDAVGATLVQGHTHSQFDRVIGQTRVVNAGSVGMPFAKAGAYWVLLGPEVRLLRTSYDLALAAVQIRATAYPEAEQFAQRNVLHPPTEGETIAGLSRFELE